MNSKMALTLSGGDVHQILDALRIRLEAWEEEIDGYDSSSMSPRNWEDATSIADHYRSIIKDIERQLQTVTH